MSRIDELDIVIRHKGGKVIAGIPQLSLYSKADDVHAAITALEQKRTVFFGDLAESGGSSMSWKCAPTPLVLPHRRAAATSANSTLKALIVIALIAGLFTLSGALLASKIERIVETAQANMQQYTKVGGAQFWEKMERELARAAEPERELTAERKRKLLSQIHVVVERWRPFASEIAPLFADFQKPVASAGPQSDK